MPHQISVFVENKPGKLDRVTGIIAAAGINIRSVTISDSGGFGVVKLVVDKPAAAGRVLREKGLAAAEQEVVAVRIPDRPGSLHRVLELLARHSVNIRDASGFVVDRGEEAVVIVQVDDPAAVSTLLKREGIELISDRDLYFL